jgi:uncharacterized membrane protein
MYVPQIAMICLIATFPFLGLAYEFGMVATGIFGSEFAYPFAAWIAVFIQAYCVAIICWNNREKLKARQ